MFLKFGKNLGTKRVTIKLVNTAGDNPTEADKRFPLPLSIIDRRWPALTQDLRKLIV